ncbi:MAG: 5-methyltetrahydropteroyltriglutamate--homocysteine S-methyltransferase [Candidatus Desulfofervidaceae bacterium]|nr:5-methyltetrahydropteroyltriglutamate--homocysteine S-methyltransferase [Candidatus Desulfofervidaceae bacterium]
MEIWCSNLGYPRMGAKRELKKALESYWQGKVSKEELLDTALTLQGQNWQIQKEAGIDLIPVGDFSLYDHMLDMAVMLGLIPARFRKNGIKTDLDTYFTMARGAEDIPPLEMTKWFDTNYHYLVPELDTEPNLLENRLLNACKQAQASGVNPKPVLVGPYTFLKLSKEAGIKKADILPSLLKVYQTILKELAENGVEWVQIDEPALVLDMEEDEIKLVEEIYQTLNTGDLNIILQTYFGGVSFYERVVNLPVQGIGLDFVRTEENLENLKQFGFPEDKILGMGIVNGRNVWRTDIKKAFNLAQEIIKRANPKGVMIQPSCSLLHLPVTVTLETQLSPEVRNILAFAQERVEEIALLTKALKEDTLPDDVFTHDLEVHPLPEVKERVRSLKPEDFRRAEPYGERVTKQQAVLNLPLFPTTTIGSFPQTKDVRQMRAKFNRGEISKEQYEQFIREKIAFCIGVQEGLGIDVLVHGEFERSDMVEYFAQKMAGFIVTKNGWVQSYGSRCVRPPIIYADVNRPAPMTINEITYAQSLTQKPVKGMLTGPVTILNWSFVREDIPRSEVAYQIALALRDEVLDLEQAGIKIIQIDEPAVREGLPLKKKDRPAYLDWAVKAFRLTHAPVKAETQIHTHMCYAEFQDIIEAIDAMDADVISIECSRSQGDIISTFEDYHYQKEIGLGVYDIHSPRVPSIEEMLTILHRCLKVLKPQQLWVNPDCGLKTRQWKEVIPSLQNMMAAAKTLRKEVKV